MSRINSYADLEKYVKYAAEIYSGWRSFAIEVEDTWKGLIRPHPDVADAEVEIVRPARPRNTVAKLERMLGLRADMGIEVPPRDDTHKEIARVEKVERWLRAYEEYHRLITQRNVNREAVWFELMRGRGGIKTTLHEDDEVLPIWMEAPDPLEWYSVRTPRGTSYIACEYYQTRHEFEEWFNSLSDEQKESLIEPHVLVKMEIDAEEAGHDSHPREFLKVMEYWDDEQYAWSVEGYLMAIEEHDLGGIPFVEARFNSTPLKDERYASQGVLGPVLEDLKQVAILQAKLASSVEMYYFPIILYEDPSGTFQTFDSRNAGQKVQVAEGTKVTVLNPTTNQEDIQLLLNEFNKNIEQGTISSVVYATDVPQASGFLVSQILSTIKDDVIDYQDAIETMKGKQLGQMLKLMEENAHTQPDGVWKVPIFGGENGRKSYATLSPEDIAGHYVVKVDLTLDLPQDMVQKTTIFNQLFQLMENGRPRVDFRTALELSGLDQSIKDIAGMIRRVDWEWLKYNDPQVSKLYTAYLHAQYKDEIRDFEREVDALQKEDAERAQRKAEREIEKGFSDDLSVVVPAEMAHQPQFWDQIKQAVAQGQPPEKALSLLVSGNLPLGVPGADPMPPAKGQGETPMGPAAQDFSDLIASLRGQVPDGFTGYEGIDPQAMPPAMQGAVPRMGADQANLDIEQIEQQMQRGALPPPK